MTKEGHSTTRDTVTGGVRLALDITESLSQSVPFLSGAVKALKTVLDAYEVRRSRSKASPRPSVELLHLIDVPLHVYVIEIWYQYGIHGQAAKTH